MKQLLYLLLAFCAFNCQLLAQQPSPEKTVIKNVNIIAVDAPQQLILEHKDVLIENGLIKKIKNTTTGKYKGYRVIDGTGKYLVPGMSDMHVHMPRPSSDIQNREFYLLNLLNGITTIREMRGKPSDLLVRDSVRKGLILGCNTYISTPPGFWNKDYDGKYFTAAMCKDSLTKFKAQGYDFVKYLGGLSLLQFDTLVQVATTLNMKVTGHAPKADLEKAVNAGQFCIEHIEPFVKLYQKDTILFWKMIDKMIDKHFYNSPDIAWYIIQGPQTSIDKKRATYGTAYMHKGQLDTLTKEKLDNYLSQLKKDPLGFAKYIIYDSTQVAIYSYLLPLMHQKGLQLLIGGDPDGFLLPGYCVITEMKTFVDAGISPFETIKCATYNAANCLGESDLWGSIAENKQADMVLLAANPLENIENIKQVDATLIKGNVLMHDELLKQLHTLQQSYELNP